MIVWLSLGSNLGERDANLRTALHMLEALPETLLEKTSSIIETKPWGYTRQPQFLNCAARIETTLTPDDLLKACQDIERRIGRERNIRWGPRTIDIDIVFYGDRVIQQEHLKIPHIHAHERRFVLEPLVEIDPDLVHPILNMTVSQLFERLES